MKSRSPLKKPNTRVRAKLAAAAAAAAATTNIAVSNISTAASVTSTVTAASAHSTGDTAVGGSGSLEDAQVDWIGALKIYDATLLSARDKFKTETDMYRDI